MASFYQQFVAGSVLMTGLTALGTWTASNFQPLADQGWGAWVIVGVALALAFSLTASLLTLLLFGLARAYRAFRPVSPGAAVEHAPESPPEPSHPIFFRDRSSIDRAGPPVHQAGHGAVCASLLVGRKTRQYDDAQQAWDRLVLPDPDSPSLQNLHNALGTGDDLATEIRRTTAWAIQSGTEVRWCPAWTGYSWHIVNARGRDGFAHIEFVMPFSRPAERFGMRIDRRNDEELFLRLVKFYNRLWDGSRRPEEHEYARQETPTQPRRGAQDRTT